MVGGCGCLTLIVLCAVLLVVFYNLGYLSKSSPFSFGENTWKRDADQAFAQFEEPQKKFSLELAGNKYHGVVHASGYYRLEGNTLFSTLNDAWLDSGRGGGANAEELTANVKTELNFKQERKRTVAWIDANTFALSEGWRSPSKEIWRRQLNEVHPNNWHYSASHEVPERWVDNGWRPVESKRPAPSDSALGEDEQSALMAAAVSWLSLVDAGKYRESFAAGSEKFRKDLTAEKWGKALSTMQKQFGALVARTGDVNLKTRRTTAAGKETITYLLSIETKFQKTIGTEQVTMEKEAGEWKVADYSVSAGKAP